MAELPRQSDAGQRYHGQGPDYATPDQSDDRPTVLQALEAAERYARLLESERIQDRETADPALYTLRASQGYAHRMLIYECTFALVAAVSRLADTIEAERRSR